MSKRPTVIPPGERHQRLITAMAPELLAACDVLRENLAKVGPEDVLVRHRIGALVLAAQRSPDKYGKNAVYQVARCLAFHVRTLYRCAAVAAAWTLEDLTAVLRRKSVGGLPLRWTHVALLAPICDPRRTSLIELTLEQGLSPTALRGVIEQGGDARLELPNSRRGIGSRHVRGAARLLVTLRKWEREWTAKIADQSMDARERGRLSVMLAEIAEQVARVEGALHERDVAPVSEHRNGAVGTSF